jgi:hypothetical protein
MALPMAEGTAFLSSTYLSKHLLLGNNIDARQAYTQIGKIKEVHPFTLTNGFSKSKMELT